MIAESVIRFFIERYSFIPSPKQGKIVQIPTCIYWETISMDGR